MKHWKLSLCAAVATFGFGTAAMADGPAFAFNASVTSDYVFRGVSQNAGKAAAQGGVDFTDNIFYAGTWLSNVDFTKNVVIVNGSLFAASFGDPSTYENDLYLGVRPTFWGVSWDLGDIYYNYINNSTAYKDNFNEVYLKGSEAFGANTVGGAVYYSNNFFENVGSSYYLEVNDAYAFKNKVTVSGAVDYQALTKSKAGIAGYWGWNIGATYPVTDHFSIDARYWGTDGTATSAFKYTDLSGSSVGLKKSAGDRLSVTGKVTF